MLYYYLALTPLLLVPYASAAILPSWRWMLAALLVGSALLASGLWWLPERPVNSLPEGEGRFYGALLAGGIVIVYLFGLAVRLLTNFLHWRLLPALALHLAVFLSLVAAPDVAFRVSWAYRMWPPSEACRSATFDVHVEGLRFAIPAVPLVSIHTDPANQTGIFSLTPPVGMREFCSTFEYGRKPVTAVSLSIRYLLFPDFAEYCAKPHAWAVPVCTRQARTRHADGEFPGDARVFSPRATLIAGPLSTETESNAPLAGPRSFVARSELVRPDGKPLIFACTRESMRESLAYCRAAYPWRGGAHIGYTFFAPTDQVEEHGRRHDAAVRQLFESLLKPR